jgi:hypothetical protein
MHDYMRAPASEGVRGGSAYSGARAGDQDGLVLEFFSLIHGWFL